MTHTDSVMATAADAAADAQDANDVIDIFLDSELGFASEEEEGE